MNDLVDTTEMYLRTILELEEEEVPALRARIAERLRQSGPTVSQTVARMERDGLLRVEGDRHLSLTEQGPRAGGRRHAQAPPGRAAARQRHRHAVRGGPRRGVPLGARHERGGRAARCTSCWAGPTRSPYGNPIPGLNEFDGARRPPSRRHLGERNLAFPGLAGTVTVSRICESVQTDADVLRQLHAAGMDPGANVVVAQERDAVIVEHDGESVRLPREIASRVFVAAA